MHTSKPKNKPSRFSSLPYKCTFHNSCSNSSLLLFKFLACLVFLPISASPLLANILPHPLLLPWCLQALVMHIILNLSFCPNLLMHASPWPTLQKPNTIIWAPINLPCLLFFLFLKLGVFTPSFFSPWSLALFISSKTLHERTHSMSYSQPGMPPSSSNLICISCNRNVHQCLPWLLHQICFLGCSFSGQLVGIVWISFVHILLNLSTYLYCHPLKFSWPETMHILVLLTKYSTFTGLISSTGTSFHHLLGKTGTVEPMFFTWDHD